MERAVKRSIDRNHKLLDKIVKKVTIKRLKSLGIDFVVSGDKIVSTRSKDVENLYNSVMMEVLATFTRTGGSTRKIKTIYKMK